MLSVGSTNDIVEMKNALLIEIKKLDKFFDAFLDNTDLRPEEPNTIEWKIYKDMMEEYGRVRDLIRTADHYLERRS
jgi:hypothetical protein